MRSYDVLVIGSDRGGLAAAQMAASGGLSVAIVAQNFAHGDVVLATVCDVAAQVAAAEISPAEAWPKFITECRELAEQKQLGDMTALTKAGIDCYAGTAQIAAPGHVKVKCNSEVIEVKVKKVILAAGSRPRGLVSAPVDDLIVPAEKLDSLEVFPLSALVVGDTVPAYEVAWALQTLGCQVTWVYLAEQPLSGFEEADFQYATQELRRLGVNIRSRSKVRLVEVVAEELKIIVDDRSDGQRDEIRVGSMVTAIGRRPHSASLDLDKLKIVLDKRGHIQVDNSMLTGEPGVYAVGDLLPTLPWPHVSAAEGRVAAQHILGKPVNSIRYQHIPLVARAWPALCALGLTSQEAEGDGYLVQKVERPISFFLEPNSNKAAQGRVTVVFDHETKDVLGVHFCGDECWSSVAAAIEVLNLSGTLPEACITDPNAIEFAAQVFRKLIKKTAGD